MQILKHFINGRYVAGEQNALFDLVSPVNGEVYAQSPDGGAAEVDQAYAAAKAASRCGNTLCRLKGSALC